MKTTPMTEKLYNYVINQCDLPHAVLESLCKETLKLEEWYMQISRDQGAFMHMMAKLVGAKRTLEIGCYTGYSAICVASALGAGGKLITFDKDEKVVNFAKKYFAKADLENKIEVRLGDAKENLDKMKKDYTAGSFDMAFIDADKESLFEYFEHCLYFVRPNGLIIVDNALWSGRVVDDADESPATTTLKRFNKKVLSDKRVERAMLHIADGIYMLRKV